MLQQKAQGSLEYLLLIGGAVVVGSIVIVLLLGASNSGGSQAKSGLRMAQVKQLMALSGVGYWAFDETSGVVANDSSGNLLNGTSSNTSFVPGKFGGAFGFNGNNSYVVVPVPASGPSKLDITTDFTLAAWINPGSANNGEIFNKEYSYEWACQGNGPTIQWALQTGGGPWYWADTGVTCPIGQWHFFALTYDGTNVKVYKDGGAGPASVLGNNHPGPLVPSTSAFCIGNRGGTTGQNPTCSGQPFNGSIDEVMIANRVLSDTEIASLSGA